MYFICIHMCCANHLIVRLTVIANATSGFGQYLLWMIYNLTIQIFCMLFVYFVSPFGEASGVAAMRALLNGAKLDPPLRFSTFLVRLICLPLILGASVVTGKTDMYLAAALAYHMSRIPLFSALAKSPYLVEQLLACGIATGIGANYGTPLAGVIFAIEVIGSFYSLRTFLKSFYGSVITAGTLGILYSAYRQRDSIYPLWKINLPTPGFTVPELILFILVGVICGIVAPLFTKIANFVYKCRYNPNLGKRKFLFFKINTVDDWKGKLLGLFEKYVVYIYGCCENDVYKQFFTN